MLRRASDVVERAGVPADLRPVAFSTAVDLLMKDPSAASRPAAPAFPAPQRSREPEPREALDLEDEEPAEVVPAASVSRLGARPSHRPVDRPLDRPAPFQGFGARSSGRSDRLVERPARQEPALVVLAGDEAEPAVPAGERPIF